MLFGTSVGWDSPAGGGDTAPPIAGSDALRSTEPSIRKLIGASYSLVAEADDSAIRSGYCVCKQGGKGALITRSFRRASRVDPKSWVASACYSGRNWGSSCSAMFWILFLHSFFHYLVFFRARNGIEDSQICISDLKYEARLSDDSSSCYGHANLHRLKIRDSIRPQLLY
jgi:hypothetical protein